MAPETNPLEELIQAIHVTGNLLSRREGSAGPSLVDELYSDYDAGRKITFLRECRGGSLRDFVDGYASHLKDSIYELIANGGLDEAEIVAFEALDELSFQIQYLLQGAQEESLAASNPTLAMAA